MQSPVMLGWVGTAASAAGPWDGQLVDRMKTRRGRDESCDRRPMNNIWEILRAKHTARAYRTQDGNRGDDLDVI